MNRRDHTVTGTLLFILFLLNILLAFSVLLLYMRQNRLLEIEKQQKLLLEESEQVITSLVQEIKEENEQFLLSIQEVNMPHTGKRNTAPRNVEEKKAASVSAVNSRRSLVKHHAVNAYQATIKEQDSLESSLKEPSLEEQVESLAAKGLTVSEIAKALQRGKTEVELLMKFR